MGKIQVVICRNNDKTMRERNRNLANKKSEITIHSSAAEYLTYVASVGDQADSFEMRYEAENIWRQWAYRGCNYPEIPDSSNRRFAAGEPGSDSL